MPNRLIEIAPPSLFCDRQPSEFAGLSDNEALLSRSFFLQVDNTRPLAFFGIERPVALFMMVFAFFADVKVDALSVACKKIA